MLKGVKNTKQNDLQLGALINKIFKIYRIKIRYICDSTRIKKTPTKRPNGDSVRAGWLPKFLNNI